MNHLVYQPHESNLCGQACVATLVGVDLDDACELVGKRGYTNTRHIRDALAKKGFVLGPRITPQRWRDTRPHKGKTFMARVRWPGKRHSHWILVLPNGKVFDPAFGYAPDWTDPYWKRGSVSSLYEVEESVLPTIRELALEATRLMDTINREELSLDKYAALKKAAVKVHNIRQLAGG